MLFTVIVWWLPYLGGSPRSATKPARCQERWLPGRITADDIGLVSCDSVGTSAPAGHHRAHLTPVQNWGYETSSSRLPRHRHYRCIRKTTISRSRSSIQAGLRFDDYSAHVVTYFDADWCLKNNIRFFYLPSDVWPNHGLKRAREIGLLHPIRTVSSSGLYEVVPWGGPPSPYRCRPHLQTRIRSTGRLTVAA